MDLLFAKIRSSGRESLAQNSRASSRAIPLGRNSFKLGAKITIWIHFSTPGSRAGEQKANPDSTFFAASRSRRCCFFFTYVLIIWNSVPMVEQNNCSLPDFEALQVGFQESNSELGHFTKRSKKPK
jgi:hypothetical protein